MKKNSNKTKKHIYFQPHIEVIILDKDISLTLDSTPPGGPGELTGFVPENLNNDPFKTQLG